MLEAIRKRSASFLVKLLFGMLVLSFGLWGIADVFSPGQRDNWVAEVGDIRVPAATMTYEYQRELRRLNAVVGNIDPEQARALGFETRQNGTRTVELKIEDLQPLGAHRLLEDVLGETKREGTTVMIYRSQDALNLREPNLIFDLR